jgi:type I restriction enzyme S subunit
VILAIGDIFDFIRNGMSVKQSSDIDGLPITRIETIWNAEIDLSRVGYAGVLFADAQNYLLKDGDILFSHINSVAHIGKCALYSQSHGELVHGMNLLCFRPNQTKILPKYALYTLRSNQFKDQLARSIKKAVNQASVTIGDIKKIQIEVPPLAEQQRIAAILDKAHEIKCKRELAIKKLDNLAQSIFIQMFGNPHTNPKGFREESLLEFFKFKTGKLDSNAASVDGIYPFFTCAKEDFFIDKYAFDEEALLLAGNNANADYSVKHFRGKFNAYQRTYVINLADSRNSYIYAKDCLEFKLKELKYVSKGSSTKYLTMGIFKKMKLLVPPIELQQEYSSKILKLRQSKKIMLSDLSICNALDASMRANFF